LPGVLLDSHALYWLVSGAKPLARDALRSIARAQIAGMLYVSPISAWELTIAARKPLHKDPPSLGTGTPSLWFQDAIRASQAKIVPIRQRICLAATSVVADTGHKDAGDCYLIATSKVRRIPIVTRDDLMHRLHAAGYIAAIAC